MPNTSSLPPSATQTATASVIQNPPAKTNAALTWIFTWRGTLANLPLIFAFFWTRGETSDAVLAWSLGLFLLFLGFAVRVWAQQHIHHRWDIPIRLTGSGPYQMVRNPLYIGNTLIIVGGVVCSRLLWFAPIALVWCALVYSLVIRHEERGLLADFGEPYRQYLSQVSRWVPRSLKQPDFVNQHFGRAVVAELHCFLVALPFVAKDFLLFSPVGQQLLNSLRSRL